MLLRYTYPKAFHTQGYATLPWDYYWLQHLLLAHILSTKRELTQIDNAEETAYLAYTICEKYFTSVCKIFILPISYLDPMLLAADVYKSLE